MLGLRSLAAGGGNVMNAWSDYLRGRAVIAEVVREDDDDG